MCVIYSNDCKGFWLHIRKNFIQYYVNLFPLPYDKYLTLMKLKNTLLLIIAILLSTALQAQKKAAAKPTGPKMPSKCFIATDSARVKLTVSQAQAWADSLPLQVICDGLKKYKLYNFNFTLIIADPMQMSDFGVGNGGIPILARKAIDNLKPKDAVILKNATYIDDKGVEQKLPVISFSIVE
jgi:hypothetical protein